MIVTNYDQMLSNAVHLIPASFRKPSERAEVWKISGVFDFPGGDWVRPLNQRVTHLRRRGDVAYYTHEYIPPQPERLFGVVSSFFDFRAKTWFAGIPGRAGFIEITDFQFATWRKKYGTHQQDGSWKFKNVSRILPRFEPYRSFQPYQFETDRWLSTRSDAADAVVTGVGHAHRSDSDAGEEEQTNAGFFEKSRIEDDAGLHPDIVSEANATSPQTEPRYVTAFHDGAQFRVYLTGAARDGKKPQLRSNDWIRFDRLSSKRRVCDLHPSNPLHKYIAPMILRLERARCSLGTGRAKYESIPSIRMTSPGGRIWFKPVLLLLPIPTPEQDHVQRALQIDWDGRVRSALLCEAEREDQEMDLEFEHARREAIVLKERFEARQQQSVPSDIPSYDAKDVKYLQDRDWYNGMADDSVLPPDVGRGYRRSSYKPEILSPRHSRKPVSQSPTGQWYTQTFPAPKPRKTRMQKHGIADEAIVKIVTPKNRAKGFDLSMRISQGKITVGGASHASGEKEATMQKRVERLNERIKRQDHGGFAYHLLSDEDLIRVMIDRGLYVVFPRGKKNAVELIPVPLPRCGALKNRNVAHIGLFIGLQHGKILWDLQMAMTRDAIRKIKSTTKREADRKRAIARAQSRIADRFEQADLIYFGTKRPDSEFLREVLRDALSRDSGPIHQMLKTLPQNPLLLPSK
jgi:hypothetical protein